MRKSLLMAAVAALVLPGLLIGLAAPSWAKPDNTRPFVGIWAEPPGEKPGVVVHHVAPDSPAAKAGIKEGDVILKADDKEVKSFDALAEHVKTHKPGDKMALHIQRDGKDQTVSVTLGEHTARRVPAEVREFANERHGAFLGVHTQEMSKELKERLNLSADKGALVTDVLPDSPAAKAGLKQDDVITGVNEHAVSNPKELRDAISKMETGKDVTVKVMRGKDKMELKAKLKEAPAVPQAALRDFRNMPEWAERFSHEMPFRFEAPSESRVQELEKRVQELEKTVKDLQQKLEKSGK